MSEANNGGALAGAMQNKWTLPVVISAATAIIAVWNWDAGRQKEIRDAVQMQSELRNSVQNLERQMASISSQVSSLNDRLQLAVGPIPTMQERFANLSAYIQPVPQKIQEMDRALVAVQSQVAIVAQGLEKSVTEADRRANQYNASLQQIREMLFNLRIPRQGSMPEAPARNLWPNQSWAMDGEACFLEVAEVR